MSVTPLKILQAEDDDDDRFLFNRAIKKAEIITEIVYARDGDECLDKLKTYIPDIIFLDINMSGMNGRECLKLIRKQNIFDDIPIIILTTSNHESDITDTFQSGANLFVIKPFRYEDLSVLLKKIFTGNWKTDLMNRDAENYVLSSE